MPRPYAGGPRKLAQARLEKEGHEWIARRAAAETEDENDSEIIRRLIWYGLPRMPANYTPADDLAKPRAARRARRERRARARREPPNGVGA